ncbi:hypothetical protein IH980_01845 [Patescibacteria group bacterium]|nr:hypothetical protein [Patescibacteria group bacterium]
MLKRKQSERTFRLRSRQCGHAKGRESGQAGQAGQIGIIILLLTIVLLTIGLSIASRSVTDIRLSRQEEETTRAFDAAEAGIEDALRRDLQGIVATGGSSSVDVGACPGPDCITANYTVAEQLALETEIEEGETVEVSLVGFTGDEVSIEWATETCPSSTVASIVVAVFNPSAGSVRRTPYKGCEKTPDDNFLSSGSAVTPGYQFRVLESVDFGAGEEFMRIRAVYSRTALLVDSSDPPGNPLPAQLWNIHSEAQTAGGETRAVEVTKTLPAPSSIFDFVIFSGSNLIKN